jgi:hypothetical protein
MCVGMSASAATGFGLSAFSGLGAAGALGPVGALAVTIGALAVTVGTVALGPVGALAVTIGALAVTVGTVALGPVGAAAFGVVRALTRGAVRTAARTARIAGAVSLSAGRSKRWIDCSAGVGNGSGALYRRLAEALGVGGVIAGDEKYGGQGQQQDIVHMFGDDLFGVHVGFLSVLGSALQGGAAQGDVPALCTDHASPKAKRDLGLCTFRMCFLRRFLCRLCAPHLATTVPCAIFAHAHRVVVQLSSTHSESFF